MLRQLQRPAFYEAGRRGDLRQQPHASIPVRPSFDIFNMDEEEMDEEDNEDKEDSEAN